MLAELDFTYKVAKSQYGDALNPPPEAILKMATSNVSQTRWGQEFPGRLEVGLPANYTLIDFDAIHLRRSANLLASVITRVTPADILQTVREGQVLYQRG
jgi:cytosine/adenosine deaminase-related metal-dependent hydrolase